MSEVECWAGNVEISTSNPIAGNFLLLQMLCYLSRGASDVNVVIVIREKLD